MRLFRPLQDAIDALLRELKRIGGSVQKIQAVDEDRNADHKQDESKPLHVDVRSELFLPQSVTDYCEAENKGRNQNLR